MPAAGYRHAGGMPAAICELSLFALHLKCRRHAGGTPQNAGGMPAVTQRKATQPPGARAHARITYSVPVLRAGSRSATLPGMESYTRADAPSLRVPFPDPDEAAARLARLADVARSFLELGGEGRAKARMRRMRGLLGVRAKLRNFKARR